MSITKNKLIEALNYLGRFPEKSMKKDELLEMLNNMYSENIDELFIIINNKIYNLLKKLVQSDENGIDVNLEYEAEVYFLEDILVVEESTINEKNIHIKFTNGMKDKFIKFINKKNEEKVKITHKIANLIINIVDVYGLIEDYEVLNILNKLLNYEIDMNFMYILLYNQIDLRNDVIIGDCEDEKYIVSSLVEKPEEILEQREIRDLHYRECTIEELKERRIDNLVERKEAKEIKEFLKKRKIQYSTEIVTSMIVNIMNMSETNIDSMKKLININLNDIDEANEYLQLVFNLHNSIPQYVLYGYSSNELFKIEMEKRQKEEELKKKSKIGRNDPCPCRKWSQV